MSVRSPLAGRLLPAVLLALVAPLLATAPSQAEPAPGYVALGDSYSSGTGTRSYLADGTDCLRSALAYPSLVAAARGYALNFRACSGATVADVSALQLDALSGATSYVTISVGGNDAGFADVLTKCALPWWAANCTRAVNRARAFIDDKLPGRLATLYDAIAARAPDARVVVVGYPRIFMGKDCNAATWFSRSEMSRLNAAADLINARTSAAASAAGFSFADPTSRFLGHAVCDRPEWINGLSWPIVESYHPNRAGHASGYTPTVSPVLTGAPLRVTARTRGAAVARADQLAAQQREYARRDAAIESPQFRAPDPTAPGMRARARRHGVNYHRWLARQG